MSDKDNQINADDLLRVCSQRGEKTGADLGYGNSSDSTKISTYSASETKWLNEGADATKSLSHNDEWQLRKVAIIHKV